MTGASFADFLPALPEIVLVLGACGLMIFDLVSKDERKGSSVMFASLVLLACTLATLFVLFGSGGRLVYVTCSLLRQENQEVVDKLRARFPGSELVRAAEILGNERALPISDPSGTFLTPLPHEHGTDGFFAAVLERGA